MKCIVLDDSNRIRYSDRDHFETAMKSIFCYLCPVTRYIHMTIHRLNSTLCRAPPHRERDSHQQRNRAPHVLKLLFNDTVVGLPLGLSSLSYILVCIFATYLRNMTIRPHLIKDWFYFLFIISLINSINFSILFLFFSYDLDIMFYIINNLFTFLLYVPSSYILNYYFKALND